MRFKEILKTIFELNTGISDKGKFYNYYDWIEKKIKRGKGYKIELDEKLPDDRMSFFFLRNEVYELYTGRMVLQSNSYTTRETIISDFNKNFSTDRFGREYKKWFDDMITLNKKELNIHGSVQDLKIKNEISPEKRELLNLKEDIFNELKSVLKSNGLSIEKEQKFNVFIRNKIKRVTGYPIKSSKLIHKYFISLIFDRFRTYKVTINLYEKMSGIIIDEYTGIDNFSYRIKNIFKMDKEINTTNVKKLN